jgi:non-ribosomal peptide synthetase component F
MCALTHIGACSKDETILQMAECSFDVHVGDILGTMMIGATLIMLRPRGLMDFEYLTDVLEKKQITCLTSVPSLFYSLFHFVEDCNRQSVLEYMKSIGSGGMYFTGKILTS